MCAWWEMEYSSVWQRILSNNIYIELDHNKLQIILDSRLHSLGFSIILILRGLGGRDHFQTISISFSRRALYWNIGKYSIFKDKIEVFFLYLMLFYYLKIHIEMCWPSILLNSTRQTEIFITIYWNLDGQLVYRVMGSNPVVS